MQVPRAGVTTDERNAIVEAHLGLIPPIARHMARSLPPSFALDDLVQAGALGLLAAAEDYDASRGLTFSVYAGWRIRFAIGTYVRDCWTEATAAPLDPRMPDRRPSVEAALVAACPAELGHVVRLRLLRLMLAA